MRRRPVPLAAMALAATVIAGAAWQYSAGAPSSYPLVNLAALAVGLIIIPLMRRVPDGAALAAAPVAALIALGFGPAIDGVERWLAIGPLRLHALMLTGPMLAVTLQRRGGWTGAAAAGATGLLILAQPDRAASFALVAATAAAGLVRRDRPAMVAFVVTLATGALCMLRADPLEPVQFVEGVANDLAASGGMLPLAVLVLLAVAVLSSAVLNPERKGGGLGLAAWTGALVVASILGPYPTPLIGYGAASILGYCLGLGALRGSTR